MSTLTLVVPKHTARQLRHRPRRLSTPIPFTKPLQKEKCRPLPPSLDALDLSSMSPTQALATLRYLILSYLADVEHRLSNLDYQVWKVVSDAPLDDARNWAETALEMLNGIRAEVCSHLPELHFIEMSSEMENFVKSHLPDVSGLAEMRSHFPEIPDIHNVSSQISDMRTKLVQDVRSRFYDLKSKQPIQYIPILSNRLKHLHLHLSSVELSSDFTVFPGPSTIICDILDTLLSSEVIEDILQGACPDQEESQDILEHAAIQVAEAVRRSLNGVRLIQYSDLPNDWKGNEFVTHGYRFIPIERWPLILMSVFTFHNETLNIHTHLIPFVLWGFQFLPFISSNHIQDIPEAFFMFFALFCLLGSSIWHTFSGCAHKESMEFCARIDYIGIGWLISASVATVVYYGFHCYPFLGRFFLGLCFMTGLAGNVFPFMDWFNRYENRLYRITFFVVLALSAIGPMAGLSVVHSFKEMIYYIGPIIPSLASYLIGLAFYTLQFPERILPKRFAHTLSCFGIGSHCIWHLFIVLAIVQHRSGLASLKSGIVDQCMVMT